MAKVLYGRELSVPLDAGTSLSPNIDLTDTTAYLRRLPSISWDQVNRGQELYDSSCVYCHGLDGHGDGIMAKQLPAPPPDLCGAVVQSQVSDADLGRIIADGKGPMPGVGGLMDTEQLQAVLAYVRVLSPGHELYTRFCAVRHGADGHPLRWIPRPSAKPKLCPQNSPRSRLIKPIFGHIPRRRYASTFNTCSDRVEPLCPILMAN